MSRCAVLLSIPGLRSSDLPSMPNLSSLAEGGAQGRLVPSFPCLTCPVQATLTTGATPQEHGVIANGFYWRETGKVEMWTAWNEVIEVPQIWDRLHEHDPQLTSAVWFPLHSKGAGADFICTPAPIHNPDGSESLWCYTRPSEMYGKLRDTFGHFPLMNFWGPASSIRSTDWIVDSAVWAAGQYQPRFSYIYLPHLDCAAQKFGPNSPEAHRALQELDGAIGRLLEGYRQSGLDEALWLAASEYVITEVNSVSYPNRLLREHGLLTVEERDGLEYLVPAQSRAWALVDHQLTHVFVADKNDVATVADLFSQHDLVDQVLVGEERGRYQLDHPSAGEVVLLSDPESWFAYYWWLDDAKAPAFARTVDIHRKPGYDPVEMFFDPATKSTPLDARLVRGSHGFPADLPDRQGAVLCSHADALPLSAAGTISDRQIAAVIYRHFGLNE